MNEQKSQKRAGILNSLVRLVIPPDWLRQSAVTMAFTSFAIGLVYLANWNNPDFGAYPEITKIIPSGQWVYSAIFVFSGASLFYGAYLDKNPRYQVLVFFALPILLHVITLITTIPRNESAVLPATYLLWGVSMLLIVVNVGAENKELKAKLNNRLHFEGHLDSRLYQELKEKLGVRVRDGTIRSD